MSDFCKHGYVGGCRECIGQMPDGKAIEDALRAEVVALQNELVNRARSIRALMDDVAALKTKYADDLTDEQAQALCEAGDWPISQRGWKTIDAAIRRVRRGE